MVQPLANFGQYCLMGDIGDNGVMSDFGDIVDSIDSSDCGESRGCGCAGRVIYIQGTGILEFCSMAPTTLKSTPSIFTLVSDAKSQAKPKHFHHISFHSEELLIVYCQISSLQRRSVIK